MKITDIPKGRIYRVQVAARSGSSLSEYSEPTDPRLASALADQHNMDRKAMLKAINVARSESRLCGTEMMPATKPLNWDDKLETAAIIHTVDMHDNGFFDHQSQQNYF